MKKIMIIVLLTFPFLVNGGVFKCVIDGVTTYSQTPCGDQFQNTSTETSTGSQQESFEDIDQRKSKKPSAGVDRKMSKTD